MIVKVKNTLFRFKIVSEGRMLAVALKKVSIEKNKRFMYDKHERFRVKVSYPCPREIPSRSGDSE